jgi:hypothetical protein
MKKRYTEEQIIMAIKCSGQAITQIDLAAILICSVPGYNRELSGNMHKRCSGKHPSVALNHNYPQITNP